MYNHTALESFILDLFVLGLLGVKSQCVLSVSIHYQSVSAESREGRLKACV